MSDSTPDNEITLEALYPDLTMEQLAEAEYFLTRYLEIVQGIFERQTSKNLTK